MKKRRLKKWVKKLLLLVLIYSVGLGIVMLFSWRARQIDKSMEVNYEQVSQFNM